MSRTLLAAVGAAIFVTYRSPVWGCGVDVLDRRLCLVLSGGHIAKWRNHPKLYGSAVPYVQKVLSETAHKRLSERFFLNILKNFKDSQFSSSGKMPSLAVNLHSKANVIRDLINILESAA